MRNRRRKSPFALSRLVERLRQLVLEEIKLNAK
jgi:hypothetical protein